MATIRHHEQRHQCWRSRFAKRRTTEPAVIAELAQQTGVPQVDWIVHGRPGI
jgi:hypothetical protein